MEHSTIDRSGATPSPSRLPQLTADLFIADGGLETSIIFQQGVDLADFAAYVLLDTEEGRESLRRYYEPYLDLAAETATGIVLDTPTWRASLDWGTRHGYTSERLAEVNRRAVEFVTELAATRPTVDVVVNGAIGPRGDGYVVGDAMSVSEAKRYHDLQVQAFAQAGAAMVTATTMNYVEEAIGIAKSAQAAGIPAVISFTTETDGTLPTGQALGDAINETDRATDGSPAYYMINCAHPSHFADVVRSGEPWLERVKGIRANASALSHAELDEATELDRGNIAEWAAHYAWLVEVLPDLRVVGGCCGTDHEHIAAIATTGNTGRDGDVRR
jgi:S-methylmethionine-dependent homocysteine/selenocysteine methylase